MTTAPAAFLAHGSPMSALGGDAHAAALGAWGDAHRELRAIVVVSAHWQKPLPLAITSWERAPLIYDFGGFPAELYRIQYPAPGDPELAATLDSHLRTAGVPATLEPGRGLDHGAWVPLRLTWPGASIPVVQISLPGISPRDLFALGAALRPLRRDGIAIVGSGGIVHNLRRVVFQDKDAAVEPWAAAFDNWVAARVDGRDFDALFDYGAQPGAALSVPTSEHFDPIFVALGAASADERAQTIYAGFHYGTISMRSFAFGG
jgi:4,5-DOPA dioxygenase extradiol